MTGQSNKKISLAQALEEGSNTKWLEFMAWIREQMKGYWEK